MENQKTFRTPTISRAYGKLSYPGRNSYHAKRVRKGSSYVDKEGNVKEYSNSSRLVSQGYLLKCKEDAQAFNYNKDLKSSRKQAKK